jgi:hypothetical protein
VLLWLIGIVTLPVDTAQRFKSLELYYTEWFESLNEWENDHFIYKACLYGQQYFDSSYEFFSPTRGEIAVAHLVLGAQKHL